MIYYKINVLEALKTIGYSQYYLQQHKILSANSIQHLKNKSAVSFQTLDIICSLLQLQPSDIIGHKQD